MGSGNCSVAVVVSVAIVKAIVFEKYSRRVAVDVSVAVVDSVAVVKLLLLKNIVVGYGQSFR